MVTDSVRRTSAKSQHLLVWLSPNVIVYHVIGANDTKNAEGALQTRSFFEAAERTRKEKSLRAAVDDDDNDDDDDYDDDDGDDDDATAVDDDDEEDAVGGTRAQILRATHVLRGSRSHWPRKIEKSTRCLPPPTPPPPFVSARACLVNDVYRASRSS